MPKGIRNTAIVCAVEGCEETGRLCRGWCRMHYTRWQRHGDPLIRLRDQGLYDHCTIDGCVKPVVGFGLCAMHRRRNRVHGDPLKLVRGVGPRTCIVDGCENGGRIIRGMCDKHYARWKRNGDPLKTNHPNRGDKEAIRRLGIVLSQRRRAREIAADVENFGVFEWLVILDEWDNRCAYCGGEGRLAQEHVVPLSRGGLYAVDNIVPACRSCNSRKHSMTADEFMARLTQEV